MKKGAKIAIGIITPFVFASAIIGTFFGVKAAKEKVSQNQGSSVVVTPQPDNKTDDNKTDDNKQDDQKQDDNKQDDQKQDEDKKTEQDYMNECQEKLTSKVTEALQAKYKLAEISNVKLVKMNSLNGTAYFTGTHTQRGVDKQYFYTIETKLGNIENLTYEKVSENLNNFEITNIDRKSNIKESVSEELYNQLCDYVLDKVGLEGAQILNTTEFTPTTGGMQGTTLTVYNNNKVYIIEASAHSGLGQQEDHINYMLSSSTNEIKITSEESFKEFVTESTAQASAQSNVVYFDVTFPTFDSETNKETTKTLTVRQTNGKADYRGFSL